MPGKAVSVLLERRDGELLLIVDDGGRGFDPAAAGDHAPQGLSGMRERLRLVGGSLKIESPPGTVTAPFIRVPHRAARGWLRELAPNGE